MEERHAVLHVSNCVVTRSDHLCPKRETLSLEVVRKAVPVERSPTPEKSVTANENFLLLENTGLPHPLLANGPTPSSTLASYDHRYTVRRKSGQCPSVHWTGNGRRKGSRQPQCPQPCHVVERCFRGGFPLGHGGLGVFGRSGCLGGAIFVFVRHFKSVSIHYVVFDRWPNRIHRNRRHLRHFLLSHLSGCDRNRRAVLRHHVSRVLITESVIFGRKDVAFFPNQSCPCSSATSS